MSKAVTVTVTTSSGAHNMPTEHADWLKLRNLDLVNGVWVQHNTAIASAAADAESCEYIGPGESILIGYARSFYMIAISASVKINAVLALGRV